MELYCGVIFTAEFYSIILNSAKKASAFYIFVVFVKIGRIFILPFVYLSNVSIASAIALPRRVLPSLEKCTPSKIFSSGWGTIRP